ncbi:trifunctional purine biosynthetic protein adenosine-3 isoform X2 [Anthonomus grandis grandis]|uniref:trifunctional purine biosynthetic protein adenosine-3 isoform X2 n=1 Tax=Anthonomus grandis grandis TaxID=2921223 RepID=UPI002165F5C7|nr:trifunctional purine biosynthetic protein adenosine-3 isoform X2 [Anthonomus grandis grandis]
MAKNVLVVGSGGREHAMVWKLSQSPQIGRIYAAPGSVGIGTVPKATNVPSVDVKDFQSVVAFCRSHGVSLVAIGPEDPLANGIADVLVSEGVQVFGPKKNGAQIESDKDWAKAFMDRHGIPTARWKSFNSAEQAKKFINSAPFPALVVKASGLAAGKGVVVAATKEEACRAVDEILTDKKFGLAGETVVVEELLSGEEVSVLAFCDGRTIKPMLPAQDHKRIFENDEGPNTGGMGAYCPCPLLTKDQYNFVLKEVLEKSVRGFQKDGISYSGVLYAGLMLTPQGPKVLEFNCRFGDPETEVILPLLESDLYEIMLSCCDGTLDSQQLKWREGISAVGVVMASRGYPESSSKGQVIKGLDAVNGKPNHVVFHCGVAEKDGSLVTNGGRVLVAVALAPQLVLAAAKATKACEIIKFDGAQFRKDIAHKGVASSILKSGTLTYKQSGVDITAGNDLVDHIKPAAKSTVRPGVMGALGGFGGLFDTTAAGYKDPLLVSGTDGVGTKLKIAQEMNLHGTIGIDLVAMCVNDVLAHGAEPLFFLDYFACGRLDVDVAKQVVSGVAEGCRRAGCALIGGETAEMPDMYPDGEYDLAGFAVGAVERTQLMPHINEIREGDAVIALPSSGVHSNGFSLVRKVMRLAGVSYKDKAPFSEAKKSFGEELLAPTRIYVRSVIEAVKSGKVKAFAHITGGGLLENVPRVLPDQLAVEIDAASWSVPPVFAWLATAGGINEPEMLRTFNCGVGGILITKPEHTQEVLELVSSEKATIIGKVTKKTQDQVIVKNFTKVLERSMRPYVPALVSQLSQPKKKVGVLISGGGTNLQALIDATQDPTRHIGAEIVLVVSNVPDVEGLRRAERAGIATKVVRHKDYETRFDFEMVMDKALTDAAVDIVCLAGFMRILTVEFCEKWRGRLVNVHPALLPLFKGTHAQRQALEAGVRVSGCTVHFVEPDVDAGAIIVQETVPIEVYDTEETLTERIKLAEHKAYPKALKLLATGKVRLGSDKKIFWC